MSYELTKITLAACEIKVTLGLVTAFSESPTPIMAIDKFIETFGLEGISTFVGLIEERRDVLTITISDEYHNSHSVDFEHDEPTGEFEEVVNRDLTILLTRISMCFLGFEDMKMSNIRSCFN